MADNAGLMITGASGTVGQAIIGHLQAAESPSLYALGRTRPAGMQPRDQFHQLDLSDHAAVEAMAIRITGRALVTGLICAAGTDCRARLGSLDPAEFRECIQVNCLSHLQLLQAICQQPTPPGALLPIAVISSDVIGQKLPGTLVYAAAKAAAEESIRHAASDLPPPGAAILIVRLPDIGVAMQAGTRSTPPPRRTDAVRPLPILDAAARAVARFVAHPPATASLEIWHA